jgi:hypothetical protein
MIPTTRLTGVVSIVAAAGNRDTNLCMRNLQKFGATTPIFGRPHPIYLLSRQKRSYILGKSGQSLVFSS